MEEIRQISIDEFDELMEFLARAYGYDEKDWFSKHYGHIYRKNIENVRNSFIIKDNDRIVSHVGLFPLEVAVGKTIFKVGGIGGVATDPDYRGQGLMGKLLKFVIERMEEEGYAFSVLWGDRQRYGHFGWEPGGRKLLIKLTERSLKYKGIEIGKAEKYNRSERECNKIITFHERERLKVKRSRKMYKLLMERAEFEVWLGNESYMVFSEEGKIQNAVESGGTSLGILSLSLRLIKEKGLEYIRIARPYEDNDINRELLDASTGWSVEPLCSIRIIGFSRALKGFQKAAFEIGLEKYRWPENEKELLRKMVLPDDNLLDFYIWGLDHV